nr:uncharacterized protein LOC120284362 [Drosophila simulans]
MVVISDLLIGGRSFKAMALMASSPGALWLPIAAIKLLISSSVAWGIDSESKRGSDRSLAVSAASFGEHRLAGVKTSSKCSANALALSVSVLHHELSCLLMGGILFSGLLMRLVTFHRLWWGSPGARLPTKLSRASFLSLTRVSFSSLVALLRAVLSLGFLERNQTRRRRLFSDLSSLTRGFQKWTSLLLSLVWLENLGAA